MTSLTYWAAEKTEEMPSIIKKKFEDYLDECEVRGLMMLWKKSHRLYYGKDANGGYKNSAYVVFGGEQGEQALLRGNHYRSLLRRMHTMAVSERLAYDVSAAQDTPESSAQTQLGKGLLNYYLDEGGVEDELVEAAEKSLPYGEAWVYVGWDPNTGPKIVDENGQSVSTGDAEIRGFEGIDVARDFKAAKSTRKWVITRRLENKWDLAAQYNEIAEQLVGFTPDRRTSREVFPSRPTDDSDLVLVLTLYHERTPAIPEGRMVEVCGDVVLFDGDLPYDRLPLFEMRPSKQFGEDWGYSDAWDLMGPQQAYDACISSITSVVDAFGRPNIMVSKAHDINVEDVSGGLRFVTYSPDPTSPPPGPMSMPEVPATTLKAAELYQSLMETIIGINSTARGNPDANLKSGSALALVQSMAVQFASSYQNAYAKLAREVGTALLKVIQRYAKHERQAEIVGKDKVPMMRSYTGNDISTIRQVRVELGNPLMRTVAGRKEVLDSMVQTLPPGTISPNAQLAFLTDGRLEPINEPAEGQKRLIDLENQRFIEGQPNPVMPTDNHKEHIAKHRTLLDNPEFRYNQQLAQAVIKHIQEHVMTWEMTDPGIIIATGQEMSPTAGMSAGMPPEDGGGGEGGPPGGGMPSPEEDSGPVQAQVPGVDPNQVGGLPNMPTNPMTGQPAKAA